MAAFDDFKAFLVAEAAKVTSTFERLRVLTLIESWAAVYAALDANRGATLISYSIAGRSGQRKTASEMQTDLARMQRDIEDILYARSVVLVDNSGSEQWSWPSITA